MIRAVVTDIEGTTSSLSFVKDVLFPYARRQLPGFVKARRTDPAVRVLLDAARSEAGGDMDDDQVIGQMLAWIDADKKITPLKSLQGLIWEHGYRNGDFQGHIYEDAVQQLSAWHRNGYRLYIFSSGSVYAQKLLFGHTKFGDLTGIFSGYFDTHIGQKKDPDAYSYMAEDIGLPAEQILFLSDVIEELDAAHAVGMATGWLVRDTAAGNSTVHPRFADFEAVTNYFGLSDPSPGNTRQHT